MNKHQRKIYTKHAMVTKSFRKAIFNDVTGEFTSRLQNSLIQGAGLIMVFSGSENNNMLEFMFAMIGLYNKILGLRPENYIDVHVINDYSELKNIKNNGKRSVTIYVEKMSMQPQNNVLKALRAYGRKINTDFFIYSTLGYDSIFDGDCLVRVWEHLPAVYLYSSTFIPFGILKKRRKVRALQYRYRNEIKTSNEFSGYVILDRNKKLNDLLENQIIGEI
jgi:hypothetical protein